MGKISAVMMAGAMLALAGCQACGPKVVDRPPPGALVLPPSSAPPVLLPPVQQTVPPAYAPPRPAPAAGSSQQLPAPRPIGFAPAQPNSDGKGNEKLPPYVPERNT
jgi:hypothetical protein